MGNYWLSRWYAQLHENNYVDITILGEVVTILNMWYIFGKCESEKAENKGTNGLFTFLFQISVYEHHELYI